MTWLEGTEVDTTPPGRRLVALLERPQVLGAPGAVNALAGLLAKRAGFEALYISGGALTASLGLPDLGIIGLDELCANVRSIHRATGLPLIVDTDTGYGGVLNTMRAVRELENAGAAAIHIEDQQLPKKCGHLNDKRLVPAEEAAAKIAAAVRARTHMRIIARTDAAAESLDEAIRRGRLYRSAGADIVFPDALRSAEEFRSFANGVGGMLMANMTEFGRTVRVNGTRGTDHGTGTVAFVMGGPVAGGQVRGDWPGLGAGQLFEGRDLAPTTDLRSVSKGVLAGHLGLPGAVLERVFPGSLGAAPMTGLLRG